MRSPVIGINSNISGGEGETPSIVTRANYVEAVVATGGTPIVLPPIADAAAVARHAAVCDGFIFMGGPDIDPARYGAHPHPTTVRLPERREIYDFLLIEEVLRLQKPFLAICLGCQEVNVALGGTLIQDIASETPSPVRHSWKQSPYTARHPVVIEPDSNLARLLGCERVETNSAHHQAIRDLGRGLRVAARSEADGLVEAVELEHYPTMGLAVQWHPEYLTAERAHRALFEALVEAAAANRAEASPR